MSISCESFLVKVNSVPVSSRRVKRFEGKLCAKITFKFYKRVIRSKRSSCCEYAIYGFGSHSDQVIFDLR